MKSGSGAWREYPEFMAAFTIRPFRRMRFGSSRLAVAVDEVCTDLTNQNMLIDSRPPMTNGREFEFALPPVPEQEYSEH